MKQIFIEDFEKIGDSELFSRFDTWFGEKNGQFLRLRFGLDEKPLTFKSMAIKENCTRQRAQQVEVKALSSLASAAGKIFADYLEKRKSFILKNFEEGKDYFKKDDCRRIFNTLPVKDRIAIKVVYRRLKNFLLKYYDLEKNFWVRKGMENADTLKIFVRKNSREGAKPERQIQKLLMSQPYPASFEALCKGAVGMTDKGVRKILTTYFEAKIVGDDVYCAASKLRRRYKISIIVNNMKKPMHIMEINQACYELFGEIYSFPCLVTVLSSSPEIYLVQRGIFASRNVFPFTDKEIHAIADNAFAVLSSFGEFLSAKKLYREIEARCPAFEGKLNPYVVLGIIRKDKRFATRKGLMAGFRKWGNCLSIIESVVEIFKEADNQELDIETIMQGLSRQRIVSYEALQVVLKTNTEIVEKLDNGKYRYIPQEE